jgi:hypothetical protein
MWKSNFALRLQPSLLDEPRKLARDGGCRAEPVCQRSGGRKTASPARGELLLRAGGAPRAGVGASPAREDALPRSKPLKKKRSTSK